MRSLLLLLACSRFRSVRSLSTPAAPKSAREMLSLGASEMRSLVREAALAEGGGSHDLEGVYWLEHINLVVGDESDAERFYVDLLGLTKDDSGSFHVNLGQQQFHLAGTAKAGTRPQAVAGSVGLAVPNLDAVRERLLESGSDIEILSDCTEWERDPADPRPPHLSVKCPWNNVYHLYDVRHDDDFPQKPGGGNKMTTMHSVGGRYGVHRMAVRGKPGIRFVEVAIPHGSSRAVADFYRRMLGCRVEERRSSGGSTAADCAVVSVGPGVHMAFVEVPDDAEEDGEEGRRRRRRLLSEAREAMEGVHVCIYVDDFEGAYNRLRSRDLVRSNPRFTRLDSCETWEEASRSRTLRFFSVIDLDTGEKIVELEHETRPLRHGQYMKAPNYSPR